jgi:hypothetical protein
MTARAIPAATKMPMPASTATGTFWRGTGAAVSSSSSVARLPAAAPGARAGGRRGGPRPRFGFHHRFGVGLRGSSRADGRSLLRSQHLGSERLGLSQGRERRGFGAVVRHARARFDDGLGVVLFVAENRGGRGGRRRKGRRRRRRRHEGRRRHERRRGRVRGFAAGKKRPRRVGAQPRRFHVLVGAAGEPRLRSTAEIRRVTGLAREPTQAAARQVGVNTGGKLLQEAFKLLGVGGVLDVLPVDQFEFLRDGADGPRVRAAARARHAAGHRAAPARVRALRFDLLVRVLGRHYRLVLGAPDRGLQRHGEIPRRGEALVAAFRQRTRHHRIERRGQPAIERARRRRVVPDDLVDDGKVVVAVERALVRQQLVQHDPHREQVCAGIDLLPLHLLGRHVFQGADHAALRARGLAGVLDARDPEVGELDPPARLDQQVGRLDVTVHDALLVRVVERGQQVADDLEGLLQRIAHPAVQVVLEVVALDVFHDQEGDVAVAVGVVDADDVGVLQPRGRARLGAETVFVFRGRFFGQVFDLDGLDRDAPVQVGIAPLIDHTHGALAQDPDQFIAAQLFQTHFSTAVGNR